MSRFPANLTSNSFTSRVVTFPIDGRILLVVVSMNKASLIHISKTSTVRRKTTLSGTSRTCTASSSSHKCIHLSRLRHRDNLLRHSSFRCQQESFESWIHDGGCLSSIHSHLICKTKVIQYNLDKFMIINRLAS